MLELVPVRRGGGGGGVCLDAELAGLLDAYCSSPLGYFLGAAAFCVDKVWIWDKGWRVFSPADMPTGFRLRGGGRGGGAEDVLLAPECDSSKCIEILLSDEPLRNAAGLAGRGGAREEAPEALSCLGLLGGVGASLGEAGFSSSEKSIRFPVGTSAAVGALGGS